MDNKRRLELECDDDATMTPAEVALGWHWCEDWDYMVIGPGMSEFKIKKGHCYACGCVLPGTAEHPK